MAKVTVLPVPAFQTHYRRHAWTGEKNLMPSMTTPDMSYTIPELIARFASGQSLGGYLAPQFDGQGPDVEVTDSYLEGYNWNRLDISERYDIMKQASFDLADLTKGIKDRQELEDNRRAAQAKKQQDRIDAALVYYEKSMGKSVSQEKLSSSDDNK